MEMAEPSANFQYTLSLDEKNLRLIEPTKITNNRLEFSLIVINRTKFPTYTAISYAWGDQDPVDVIYINGKSFPVRPNLWSCLYYIGKHAHHPGRQFLWVDAICINQEDNLEKGFQVKSMGTTFSRANNVLAWLGLPQNTTIHSPSSRSLPAGQVEPREPPTELDNTVDWRQEIDDLANRPYWSRTWIVQELLLARSVRLHCGSSWVTLDEFKSCLHMNMGGRHGLPAGFGLTLQVTSMQEQRGELSLLDGGLTIRQLLYENRHRLCKDPRDHVFAMLGVAKDVPCLNIVFPDYNLRPYTVIAITLAHILENDPDYLGISSEEEMMQNIRELFRGFGTADLPVSYTKSLLDEALKIQQTPPIVGLKDLKVAPPPHLAAIGTRVQLPKSTDMDKISGRASGQSEHITTRIGRQVQAELARGESVIIPPRPPRRRDQSSGTEN